MAAKSKPSDENENVPSEEIRPSVPPPSEREQELLNRLEIAEAALRKAGQDLDAEKAARKKAETDAAVAIDERDTLRRVQSERPDDVRPAVPSKTGFSFFR